VYMQHKNCRYRTVKPFQVQACMSRAIAPLKSKCDDVIAASMAGPFRLILYFVQINFLREVYLGSLCTEPKEE
jgi:hypothetical protein